MGLFLHFYPPNNRKNLNLKIWKKCLEISLFTQVYQKSWSYALLCLRFFDPNTGNWAVKTCSQKFDLHMQFIIFLKTFCMCVGMCTCDTTPLLKGSNHTEGNAEVGGSRNLILFSNDVKSCSTELYFQRKA